MSGRDPLSGTTPVDSSGNPYPLATIDYYIVGTTTREDTFTTAALSVAHTNPVVLGADGRIPEIFFSQTRMKRVFKDADGNTISGLSWDGIDKSKQRIRASSAPSPTYPGLEWVDSDDDILYERNSTNDGWVTRGDVDSVGNAASVTETLTGTATDKLVTPDSLAAIWQRGTNLTPSAGTVSLPSSGGGVFNIAAGNFSAISTARGGRSVKFIFSGKSVITHDGTSMILPRGVDIATQAGDIAVFTNEAAADSSGTNWRMSDWAPVGAAAIAAKTGNYTATTADRGGSIVFSGLSADCTLTLPAAADCGNGFILYVSNEDTTFGASGPWAVTVDGNGGETIDGKATRKAYTGSRLTLMCDGSNWRTVGGEYIVITTRQTIGSGDDANIAHGQGVSPKRVWPILECTTTEGGYSVGNFVFAASDASSANTLGFSWGGDATNLFYVIGSNGAGRIFNKTTGAAVVLTTSSWSLRLAAAF